MSSCLRQYGLDRIDHLDDVGARVLIHLNESAGLPVVEAGKCEMFSVARPACPDPATLAEPHRRTIAIGD